MSLNELDPGPYFADLARRLVGLRSVEETMAAIVHAAVEVADCDHASLSHLRGQQLVSASSNDEVGELLDAVQTQTQEGPCLDAIRMGDVVVVNDLAGDTRYASYGPRAVEKTGVRSSLGVPLKDGRRTIGALNLFSDQLATFHGEPSQEALIAILAAHAAPALAAALYRQDMEAALKNRDLIGQAKGILMARLRLSDAAAFNLLVGASQRMNVKLTEVARQLIDGTLPIPPS
jgi:GAF domain-containing protein